LLEKLTRRPYPDHDLLLHVIHDVIPILGVLRRLLRDQVLEVTGLDVGRDPAGVDVVQVVETKDLSLGKVGADGRRHSSLLVLMLLSESILFLLFYCLRLLKK
jgi:hypothetical protein